MVSPPLSQVFIYPWKHRSSGHAGYYLKLDGFFRPTAVCLARSLIPPKQPNYQGANVLTNCFSPGELLQKYRDGSSNYNDDKQASCRVFFPTEDAEFNFSYCFLFLRECVLYIILLFYFFHKNSENRSFVSRYFITCIYIVLFFSY